MVSKLNVTGNGSRRHRGARCRARFLGGDAVRLAARGFLRRGRHHQGAGQNLVISLPLGFLLRCV
eukprot:COSAG05_NODE_508_length_9135_cov_30.269780_9_plen_65_part_00